MEELSPESKALYELLMIDTKEEYEKRFLDYKKKVLDAMKSTAPLRVPSGACFREPCPRSTPTSTATSASSDITRNGAATPATGLSSSSASAPTPDASRVVLNAKRDSSKDDLSPGAQLIYEYIIGNSDEFASRDGLSPGALRYYDYLVGGSPTPTTITPLSALSSAAPITGISEPAAATTAPERDLQSLTPSNCSTICLGEMGDIQEAVTLAATDLTVSAPTTCSAECPSHDDDVYVSVIILSTTSNSSTIFCDAGPEQAAPAVSDKVLDVDAMGDTTISAAVCLPVGPDNNICGENLVSKSQTLWSAPTSFSLLLGNLPSSTCEPMDVLEPFLGSSTSCSSIRSLDTPPSLMPEAYMEFCIGPNEGTFVPWPPPSWNRAITPMIRGQDSCHDTQQKHGNELLVSLDSTENWNAIWLAVELKPPWPVLGVCMNLPMGWIYHHILRGNIHYSEMMQWLFSHSLLQFQFCTAFVQSEKFWKIYLVPLKSWFQRESIYSCETLQWTIVWPLSCPFSQSILWSFSCPSWEDGLLPCSTRRVSLSSSEKCQLEIARLLDLALEELQPWASWERPLFVTEVYYDHPPAKPPDKMQNWMMLEKLKTGLFLELHLMNLVVMRKGVLRPLFQSARCTTVLLLPWDPGVLMNGIYANYQGCILKSTQLVLWDMKSLWPPPPLNNNTTCRILNLHCTLDTMQLSGDCHMLKAMDHKFSAVLVVVTFVPGYQKAQLMPTLSTWSIPSCLDRQFLGASTFDFLLARRAAHTVWNWCCLDYLHCYLGSTNWALQEDHRQVLLQIPWQSVAYHLGRAYPMKLCSAIHMLFIIEHWLIPGEPGDDSLGLNLTENLTSLVTACELLYSVSLDDKLLADHHLLWCLKCVELPRVGPEAYFSLSDVNKGKLKLYSIFYASNSCWNWPCWNGWHSLSLPIHWLHMPCLQLVWGLLCAVQGQVCSSTSVFLANLNVESEVQHHYTCTRVLTVANCKGYISDNIQQVQWEFPWKNSLVPPKFWFPRESLYNGEDLWWKPAWYMFCARFRPSATYFLLVDLQHSNNKDMSSVKYPLPCVNHVQFSLRCFFHMFPDLDAANGVSWNSPLLPSLRLTWDPGDSSRHRLEGKPDFKKGGLSTTCLHELASGPPVGLGPALEPDESYISTDQSRTELGGERNRTNGLGLDGEDRLGFSSSSGFPQFPVVHHLISL